MGVQAHLRTDLHSETSPRPPLINRLGSLAITSTELVRFMVIWFYVQEHPFVILILSVLEDGATA